MAQLKVHVLWSKPDVVDSAILRFLIHMPLKKNPILAHAMAKECGENSTLYSRILLGMCIFTAAFLDVAGYH
jgi:hypothetical protein